ncbi:MAG: sugar ABC transporter substrate-binding protein [Arachnia sp.]
MKRRGASIVVAFTLAGLALTACGGNTDPQPPAQTGGGNTSKPAQPSEPVNLTFQSLSDQPATIEVTKQIVDAWNKDNPNIQVEIVPAGWDGIYDKLITQFNGGAAPDIIHYEAASIVPFARDGYLADLGEHMSAERKADIPQGILETVTVDGKIVGYPTELQSYMVFANTKLLADAGVDIPTGDTMTWDQLREMAKKATKGDVSGLGWGLASPTAAMMAMSPGFGGTYFTLDGTKATINVGDGELALPKLVHDMTYTDKSLLPVTLTQSGGKTLPYFYDGQIAMTIQGSYQAANIANDAPEGFEWTVLPPLEGPAGADQAANPQTLSVNVDSEHIAESVQFIEYFTNTENLAAVNKADALIPATTSAQAALASTMSGETGWDNILKSGQHMASAPYLFVDTYAQWKDTVATPAFQRYFANEIDDAGLAGDLTSGWEQINR